jgi:hypothetical protein
MKFSQAVKIIKGCMKKKGYQDCDIERLGRIIPFFPLHKEEAKEILRDEIDKYIVHNSVQKSLLPYADTIEILDKDRDFLANSWVEKCFSAREGLRNPAVLLNQTFRSQLALQRTHYEMHLNGDNDITYEFPLQPPPQLTFHKIKYDNSIDIHKLKKEHKEIAMASQSVVNENNIKRSLREHSDIDYIRLFHKDIPPCVNILSPPCIEFNNNNNYNYYVNVGDPLLATKFEGSVKENMDLKRNINDIKGTIDQWAEEISDDLTQQRLREISKSIKEFLPRGRDEENRESSLVSSSISFQTSDDNDKSNKKRVSTLSLISPPSKKAKILSTIRSEEKGEVGSSKRICVGCHKGFDLSHFTVSKKTCSSKTSTVKKCKKCRSQQVYKCQMKKRSV